MGANLASLQQPCPPPPLSPRRSLQAARMDYLAMPADDPPHNLRLVVRDLTMGVMYDHYRRCGAGVVHRTHTVWMMHRSNMPECTAHG